MNYRKEWDDKHECFKTRPLHDWTSHGADAFRYLAVGVKRMVTGGQMSQEDADRMYEQYAPPIAS
jgi:hypothetical protein